MEEKREVLEDVGRTLGDKVVEDLILYEQSLDCYFLIGSNMKEWERTKHIEFLKENIKVFAWMPYEMSGIDLNFIRYELNVMPKTQLVKQQRKRSVAKHVSMVIWVKNIKEMQ